MIFNTLVAAAALLLTAGAATAQSMDTVRIAGWSKPISEITNILAEPDKGFFKAHDIEMKYVPGAGGGSAVSGTCWRVLRMLRSRTRRRSTKRSIRARKLVAIYNIYPQNVFNVVAPVGRGIAKPEDLKGKTIGVYSLSSGTRQNLQVLLHQVGLTEGDVTIKVTGLLNFAPVIQGQVDATAATDTGLYVGKLKGLGDVNVINVADSLNIPSDMFVVTEAYYAANKPLLKRFLAAYRDSAAWMIAEPEEAAKIAISRTINGRNEAVNLEIIKIRNISAQSDTTRANGLGHFDIDLLQKGAETFKGLGLIKADLDMSAVIKTDLIPE